jgi:hypothetical protein
VLALEGVPTVCYDKKAYSTIVVAALAVTGTLDGAIS